MAVRRMDGVGIVVEDLEAAIAFFVEFDLGLKGRAPIEGDWEGANLAVQLASACSPRRRAALLLQKPWHFHFNGRHPATRRYTEITNGRNRPRLCKNIGPGKRNRPSKR
jgi:hypothetical protein